MQKIMCITTCKSGFLAAPTWLGELNSSGFNSCSLAYNKRKKRRRENEEEEEEKE